MTISLRHTFGIGLLLLAGVAQAVDVTFDLTATSGSTTLPGGITLPILGYALAPATSVTAPGGPELVVTEGDLVTVNLTNGLAGEDTSLVFQGQEMVPDTTGVAPGATRTYTFTASSPGTFLYEAGLAAGSVSQAARGLHGALVVRPAVPNQAYSGEGSAFDDEAVLVLSELDPALNQSTNPAAFDMRNFKPAYRLINGRAYPATSPIATAPGNRVLLRYVNAGQQQHSMTVLGAQQVLVGKDGNLLTHFGKRVAETIAPGETLDAIVTIPVTTPEGSKFALFDGGLMLVNGSSPGFGGMLTFLEAGTAGGGGADVVGPVAQPVTVGAIVSGNVTLSATISDASSGGSNVAAAEYRVDTGAAASMTATDGSFDSPQEAVSAIVPVGGLSSGNHTFYVRGQDSLGNWGSWGAAVLSIDTAGPTTYGLVAVPPASSGTVNVALNGSASDTATGGSSIAGAEYFLDVQGTTGSGVAMTVTPGAPGIAALTATIPAATVATLSEGSHPVHVHAVDALGNWGPFPTPPLPLIVDRTGPPAPSPVAANPSATNGTTGFNSSTPAIRVTITATDALSTVAGAEGFIDTVGTPGSGFQFAPSDGNWDELYRERLRRHPAHDGEPSLDGQPHHPRPRQGRSRELGSERNDHAARRQDRTDAHEHHAVAHHRRRRGERDPDRERSQRRDERHRLRPVLVRHGHSPGVPVLLHRDHHHDLLRDGRGPHGLRARQRRGRQLEPDPERDAHRAERGERHPHAQRERGLHADEQPGRSRSPRERPARRDGRTHGQARHRAGADRRNGRGDRHAGMPGVRWVPPVPRSAGAPSARMVRTRRG